MTARICVSILPKVMAEALGLLEKAEAANADLIEERLDSLEDLSRLTDLAAHVKTPKIATDKSARPDNEQRQRLLSAAKSGFEYKIEGSTVEVTTDSVTSLLAEMIDPDLQQFLAKAAASDESATTPES